MKTESAWPADPLWKGASVWLVVPALSFLLGQASGPLALPKAFFLLFLPLPLLFSWRRRKACAAVAVLAGVAFSLGYLRHNALLRPTFSPNHLRLVATGDGELYLEGRLYREPEILPRRSRWWVEVERVWYPTGAREVSGLLLLSLRQARREWYFGDRVRFAVSPRIPANSGNPVGFDYASYLARRQIYLTGFLDNDEKVELLARAGPGLWSTVEHMRRAIRGFIDRRFAPENGALLKALVIGDRSGLSPELSRSFTVAGVAHLLSISGLHVGMFGLVAFLLTRYLGSLSVAFLLRFNLLKVAATASCLAAIFYTAMAGAQVPTVRTAIMIGVYVLALLLDREEEILNSLCLAALIIALYWPGAVMEVSFQLSFLAVLFIIWGTRKFQEWWPDRRREGLPEERWPKLRRVALYLAVPLLATIGTGPMIAYHFGYLSLAGLFANPVVVPLVGFGVVPLGLLIGFLSLVAPALALPLVWLADPLLSLVIGIVGFFSRLPFAAIAVPVPNPYEVVLLYLLVFSLFGLRRGVASRVGAIAVCSLIFADAFYWARERWYREELRVTYLDVGQGDAAVVEFPGSRVLVVDAGGTVSGEFDTGEAILAPFLRSRKILRVDYVVVTHWRVDHYGGMRRIVEEFGPSEFWSAPGRGETARSAELEAAVKRSGVKARVLASGEPCRMIDQVEFCVLYPGDRARPSSLVLRLTWRKVSFLFAGDIERRDEKALLQGATDLASAVLKVPRHGSHGSSSEEFVAAVKPKLAIFSVGRRNRFGFPRDEVVSRYRAAGAGILRTDEDGSIVIETDGETVRYRTHRSGRRGDIKL